LSREYGWTPREIDTLTIQEVSDYLDIIGIRKQLEKQEADKHKKHGKR